MLKWINNHFNALNQLLLNTKVFDPEGNQISLDEGLKQYVDCLLQCSFSQNKLIFIGNGGSAAIASHLAIDYNKNHYFKAMAFNDAAALTCLSNDYGYENVFAKQMEFHAEAGDVLIAISSSGRSPNMLKAVSAARKLQCRVITFSGFELMNPLSRSGDLNFHVASDAYGLIEVAHLALGHTFLDYVEEQEKISMLEEVG